MKSTLQDCLDAKDIVKTVGPIVMKGPSEAEVNLMLLASGPDSQRIDLAMIADFKLDQSGKYFLFELNVAHSQMVSNKTASRLEACKKKLPFAAK